MTTTFYLTSVYGATVIVFMSLGFSSNTKVMALIPGESGIQCSLLQNKPLQDETRLQ